MRKKLQCFLICFSPDGSPWHPKPHDTICSAHFIDGKKSDAEADPSYAPTIFPPNHSQVASELICFMKQINTDQQSTSKDQYKEVEIKTEVEEIENNRIVEGCQADSQIKLKQTTSTCNRYVQNNFGPKTIEIPHSLLFKYG